MTTVTLLAGEQGKSVCVCARLFSFSATLGGDQRGTSGSSGVPHENTQNSELRSQGSTHSNRLEEDSRAI